jgi:hypothetical protein
MSNAQIWIAIVLGFILLAMAINAFKFRNLSGMRPPSDQREHDQAVQDELARIRAGVEDLSTKVDAIERMLVEVQ